MDFGSIKENGFLPLSQCSLSPIRLDHPILISILLHQLLNVSPNELNSIKSSGNSRYGFIKQMLLYFSTHLGYPVELKSLEVLHELF